MFHYFIALLIIGTIGSLAIVAVAAALWLIVGALADFFQWVKR